MMQRNDMVDAIILFLLIASLATQIYALFFQQQDEVCNAKVAKLIEENNHCKDVGNACILRIRQLCACTYSSPNLTR
jgi:hypothetical protein